MTELTQRPISLRGSFIPSQLDSTYDDTDTSGVSSHIDEDEDMDVRRVC
jgi:hypothetical protein